jgi:hypothetical protein
VSGRAFSQIFDPARLAKSDTPADRGGRAPRSGRGGRRFKSCHSDQLPGPTAADPERYPESFPRQHHSIPERASGSVCGIDTGTGGGIALLGHAGGLLAVDDLPALPDGLKGRAALNGALLALVIRRWSPSHAYVEFVASPPTDKPSGRFFIWPRPRVHRRRPRGVRRSCAVAHGASLAQARGTAAGRGEGSRAGEVIRRWPRFAESFARVRDADRAEAALIGLPEILRDARQAVQVDPEPIGRFSDLVVA